MNDKQRRFVAEYLIDRNATQAAIRAGYSKKTAKQIGSRLLTDVDVASAVAEKAQVQLDMADISAQRVLNELGRLSFSDLRGFCDEHGNLKPIHTLTDAQAAALAGVEVIVKNAQAGDGHTDTVHKIKLWDKPRALEMLAKHFALLIERVHVTGDDVRIQRLQGARKRGETK